MSRAQPTIGFIGGGNMAAAIIGGLLRAGHPARRILVAEPHNGQRAQLARLNADIELSEDNQRVATNADLLVLAVKPQVMATVAHDLGPRPDGQLLVSIAAGITLASLQDWFGATTPIVRVMPNQPAMVGAGMSVLAASGAVSDAQREQAAYVLAATGEIGWVDDEQLLDAVTAISGSGPAYFYLLMEILEDCARDMGIPAELAGQLARQTAYGAGMAATDSSESLKQLRARVTSPGGTTAAAIESLEKARIRDIVIAALQAARARSVELGAAKTND